MASGLVRNNPSTLVLGAGELGMSVLRRMAARVDAGTVSVLLRDGDDSSAHSAKRKRLQEIRSLGVSTVVGDLTKLTAAELGDIFRPYDTVVSCTGFVGGRGTQRKIAEAALTASVRRYVPWQFGVDYDRIGRGSAQDLFDEQLDVRDLLRAQAETHWIIISTGMFTSFLFDPSFGVFDFHRGVAHALGDWDNAVTITTAEDIGRLTSDVLAAEPPILDRIIFLAGDTVTYRQAADLVEEVLDVRLHHQVWTVPWLRQQLEAHPDDALAKYRMVFAEGRGVSWPQTSTFNHERGIPVTALRQWLTEQRQRLRETVGG